MTTTTRTCNPAPNRSPAIPPDQRFTVSRGDRTVTVQASSTFEALARALDYCGEHPQAVAGLTRRHTHAVSLWERDHDAGARQLARPCGVGDPDDPSWTCSPASAVRP